MNKKSVLRLIIILAVIAAAVVFLCYKLYKKNSTKVVDVYPVSTLSVPNYEDQSTYYSTVTRGKLQEVTLRDGLISEIRVKENDSVREGDVLMVYDKTALNLSLNSDIAHIALLESQIEKANRNIARISNLIPSEYAPSESEETIDHGPLKLKDRLTASDCKKDKQIIKCSIDTVIKTGYLKELRKKGYTVTLEVYEEDALFGYYTIKGSEIPETVDVYEKYDPSSKTKKNSLTSFEGGPASSESALFVRYKLLTSEDPTVVPTEPATPEPTVEPTPTEEPTPEPTEEPTPEPTETVTPEPSETVTPEPTDTVTPEPSETVTPEPTDTVTPEPTETVTPEPTDTVTPEPTETVTPKPTQPVTPGPTKTVTPTPTPGPELYIKLKADPLKEDWILSDIAAFNGSGADVSLSKGKQYYGTFSSTIPEFYERYETVYNFPEWDPDSEDYIYSKKDLAEMIAEQQKEIESLTLSLRSARLTYQQDLLISETGEVKAALDGTVTKVADPASVSTGETLITVKGAENYMVSVYVPEMNLPDIHPGDVITGTAYESGNMFTGVIKEIGNVPTNDFSFGESNPNSSTYPVTAAVNETDIELRIGEMCEVRFEQEEEAASSAFFLPNMFIRNDERGSYVYVSSEDRLKKQYIQTGRSLWGSYLEIKAGVDSSDSIAFPYGKGVTEGSPVQLSENFYY